MRSLKSMVLGSVCVAAATMAAEAKDIKVGFSIDAIDNIAPVKYQEYLEAEGKKQGEPQGITFKWIVNVANEDPTRQAANIEDLINQGVDLILARAADSSAIGASIRAAKEAGIPFMTIDRQSKTTKPTVHVGGDSYDEGKTTAEGFVALLKSKNIQGKCIELLGALTDENAVSRSKGWHDVTDKSGVIETVQQVPTEWNPDLYRSGSANALRAHPEANCMFMASDFAWPAVQSSLEGAGKWALTGKPNHLWMATQDVFPEAALALQQGYIDIATTYDVFLQSKEAIRVAIRLAKGESVDCPEAICLAKGRLAIPETVGSLENLWSRPSK